MLAFVIDLTTLVVLLLAGSSVVHGGFEHVVGAKLKTIKLVFASSLLSTQH